MAFIPVPNGAQVEIRCLQELQEVENRIFCTKVSFTQAHLDALTAAISLWWVTDWAPLSGIALMHREVYAKGVRVAADIESTDLGAAGTFGGINQESLPLNVSLCVSLRTGFVGRSNRGRWYSLGAVESQANGSQFSNTYANSVATALQNLAVAIAGAGWVWVVNSFFTGGAPRTSGLTKAITELLVVDPIVDSMRRRLPGRGM